MMTSHVPLVVVDRSGVTECTYRGSVVIIQGERIIASLGTPQTITPIRSTAKPFQIISLLDRGGVEAFNLELQEIAFMVSSHNGEPQHLETARNILAKANISEELLSCGVHPPFFFNITQQIFQEQVRGPDPLHNNCSGKHIGMLLLGKLMNVALHEYWKVTHPIQQTIITSVASIFGLDAESISLGIDGCGVPTYNVEIQVLARAYAKLADPTSDQSNLQTVVDALISNPFMLAGSMRLDTELIELKRIIAKSGAQGIYCMAIPQMKIGLSIKIESGSEEASECVALEVLRQLGILSVNEVEYLAHKYFLVKTWPGEIVGKYSPVFQLMSPR